MINPEQQRKQVTVLFADVSGFTAMSETMDAEDVTNVMNELWQRLDGAIVRHGGRIDKHIGDAVMALWGTAVTREDDPERAIHAALAMQREILWFAEARQTNTLLRIRIGINTGPAVLGEVGTTGEFTAIGDTVNTASRLEHAAPVGGILISHETYQHVRNIFDVIEQKPLTVKGKKEPLKVYTVEKARPRSFRLETRGIEGLETKMIGRQTELERLQDTFYLAVQGREQHMFTISEEAGLGKSRLLREFENWLVALPKQLVHFQGRADQEMQTRPYALLRDMFSSHFKIKDSDSRPEVIRKLEQWISSVMGEGEGNRQKAHFIGHLLGFDMENSPFLTDILEDARSIRDQALTFLGDYFRAVTVDHAAVIFLEDIHWADESSLQAIDQLMQSAEGLPLFLVCLARPPLFERRPKWGVDRSYHQRLEIQPLSKVETSLLVDEILRKVEELPQTLKELVVENSQGNPFYVEELIRMLIEDEVIITSSSQWLVNPARLSEVRIPATLIGVLQARLDSLNHSEREILQRAAVIGRAFWDDVISFLDEKETGEEASEKTADVDTRHLLDSLRERELILQHEATSFEGVQEYAFKNVLLREVAYESVLKRERRAYHARVAQWLIDHSGERAQEYASLIAEHLEKAEQRSEAVAYLKVAGEQAQKSSAFSEALNFFKRALALLAASDREERMVLMRQIGRALYELGQWDAAREQLQESLDLAKKMANPREIANNLMALGFVAEQQGRYAEAKERLQESLDTARKMADPGQIVASLRGLGNLAEKQGKYNEAKERLEESLTLARQYGDQIGAAQAAAIQGALDTVSGTIASAKTKVSDTFSRLQLSDDNKERLGKSFKAFGRFARRRGGDEEE